MFEPTTAVNPSASLALHPLALAVNPKKIAIKLTFNGDIYVVVMTLPGVCVKGDFHTREAVSEAIPHMKRAARALEFLLSEALGSDAEADA